MAHLITSQRRLRHLVSIHGRSMCFSQLEGSRDRRAFRAFFTLHRAEDDGVFYTSEEIFHSENPSWRNIDAILIKDRVDFSKSTCILRVWVCWAAAHGGPMCRDCTPFLRYALHLHGLAYLGRKLEKESYPPNTVIIQLTQGFFWAPEGPQVGASFAITASKLKLVYDAPTIGRVETECSSLENQDRAKLLDVRGRIAAAIAARADKAALERRTEETLVRIARLQRAQEQEQAGLQRQRQALEQLQASNARREAALSAAGRALQRATTELRASREDHDTSKVQLSWRTVYVLNFRRTRLVLELCSLFPIENRQNVYSILSLPLPASAGQPLGLAIDDETTAAALGYACQLTVLLSKYLRVPLCFPLRPMGSRSLVRDDFTGRELVLFRGKDRASFEQAVHLLIKDVKQLLSFCHVSRGGAKDILGNLNVLFSDFSVLDAKYTRQLHLVPKAAARPAPMVVAEGVSGRSSPESTHSDADGDAESLA